MTPDELRARGERRHGRRWQNAMSQVLDIDGRTVRRWVAGHPIPAMVQSVIRREYPLDGETSDEPVLHHLTTTTGHLAMSPRSAIDDVVVDLLLRIVDTEHGWVPLHDRRAHVEVWRVLGSDGTPVDGAALAVIGPSRESKRPWALMAVCWRHEMADRAWQGIQRLAPSAMSQPAPIGLPWAAVDLGIGMPDLPPACVHMLGDLERCLAWAIIEASGR